VLDSSDVAENKTNTDALQEAWNEAAGAIYAQATAGAPAGDGPPASDDDEVIEDADYEVVDEEEAKTS
jgi:hypothetical protein